MRTSKISRKKKTLFIIGVVIVALILLCVGRFVWAKLYYTPQRIYELNWKLDFPADTQVVYNITSEEDLRGEGIKYTIFDVDKDKVVDFIDGWENESSENFEQGFKADLEMIDVPAEKYPHFDHIYDWISREQYSNELFMMYDYQENQLYVLDFIK